MLASPVVAGFPITSFESGTPPAAIWKSAVWGHVLEDVVSKLAQVVYSLDPSEEIKIGAVLGISKDCALTVVELSNGSVRKT